MSAGQTYVYDPDQITISFAGVLVQDGWGDDSFCKIEKVNDAFTVVEGTDGSVTRSKNPSKLHKITITLQQSSATNSLFSAVHALDQAAPNGAGIAPILVKDRAGTSLHSGSKAWITKIPDAEYARTSKSREWVLMCSDMDNFVGGN